MLKELQSLQHPLVKHLVKLREKREYRRQCQTALLSGDKLIQELASSHRFKTVLIEKGHVPPFVLDAEQRFSVDPSILKKVTGLVNPERIAVEIALPRQADLKSTRYLLILDGISDPGNMGTLLRTALGLGWEGVWITSNSTDPFNEKALRAAKGATFKIPLRLSSLEELTLFLQTHQRHLLCADIKGKPLREVRVQAPLALALGNEAHGLSELIKKQAQSIRIPMDKQMESLNVASAGAILMHYLKD